MTWYIAFYQSAPADGGIRALVFVGKVACSQISSGCEKLKHTLGAEALRPQRDRTFAIVRDVTEIVG